MGHDAFSTSSMGHEIAPQPYMHDDLSPNSCICHEIFVPSLRTWITRVTRTQQICIFVRPFFYFCTFRSRSPPINDVKRAVSICNSVDNVSTRRQTFNVFFPSSNYSDHFSYSIISKRLKTIEKWLQKRKWYFQVTFSLSSTLRVYLSPLLY